jgi:hypothetical protein
MSAKKQPGRRRFDIVAEPEWLDLVAVAAKATERSVSGYIRLAVNAQLERDGFKPAVGASRPRGRPPKATLPTPPAEDLEATAKKPRGHSRKGK